MPNPPEWAEPPGYGWEHRGNFSDSDVVWYHNDQVVYQTFEGYSAPKLAPVVIPEPPAPKRNFRSQVRPAAIAAATSAIVALLVSHVKF